MATNVELRKWDDVWTKRWRFTENITAKQTQKENLSNKQHPTEVKIENGRSLRKAKWNNNS